MLNKGYGQGFQLVFNIINQKALPIIENASSKGMGIISRMPLQFGLLTGKFNKDSAFPVTDHRSFRLTPGVLRQSLNDLEPVWPMAAKYPYELWPLLPLSFILSHAGGFNQLFRGSKTPQQAIANAKGIVSINAEDISILHDLYEDRFNNLLEVMK